MALRAELAALLEREREIYAVPRGRDRFDAYLKAMTDETGVAVLPLTALNPMGREHVAELIDRMIALGVEAAAADAVAQARDRLVEVDDEIRVGVVVLDDLKGGWTNRYFAELANRFERKYEVAGGWATVPFWTSEETTLEHAHIETLKSVYRTLYERKHGPAHSLREMMAQEGRAARFAGLRPDLDDAALAETRRIIGPHLDSKAYPVIAAALYGDEAALSLGYPALGLAARAGYAVALSDALAEKEPPESKLAA